MSNTHHAAHFYHLYYLLAAFNMHLLPPSIAFEAPMARLLPFFVDYYYLKGQVADPLHATLATSELVPSHTRLSTEADFMIAPY